MLTTSYTVKETKTVTLEFEGARLTFFQLLCAGAIDHCYVQLSFMENPSCLYRKFERHEYQEFRMIQETASNMRFRDLTHLTDTCLCPLVQRFAPKDI